MIANTKQNSSALAAKLLAATMTATFAGQYLPLLPALGNDKSLAGPVSLHKSPHAAESGRQAAGVPNELRALWKEPSADFKNAVGLVGSEPAEQSITKLKAFVAGPMGLNLASLANMIGRNPEKQAAAYVLARLLAKGSNDSKKQALEYFRQAQGLSCLRVLSLWHQSEIVTAQASSSSALTANANSGAASNAGSNSGANAGSDSNSNSDSDINGISDTSGSSGDNADYSGSQPTTAAEKQLQNILNAISKDPLAQPNDLARAQYELAQSYMRMQASDRAGEILRRLQEHFPSSEYARGANYYLGLIARESNPPEALARYRAYLKGTTGGRFSQDVAEKLMNMDAAQPGLLTGEDANLIGQVLLKKGDYGRALGYLQRGGDLFRISQCQARMKQRDEALNTLFKAIAANPASSNYEDYVSIITDPMTRAETRAVWLKILSLPAAEKPKRLDQALWNVANRSDGDEGDELYARVYKEFPTSEYAPESMWWVFWHKTKKALAQPENKVQLKALSDFASQAATRFPKHRSAARFLFWAGKLHERMKDPAQAIHFYNRATSLYPANYYGGRSRARLSFINAPAGKKFDQGWTTHPARTHIPQDWDWPGPERLFHLDTIAAQAGPKVAVLAGLRQFDEALGALQASQNLRDSEDAREFAGFKAWAYLSQSLPLEAIRAAGADLDGHPRRDPLWEIDYPFAYCRTINEQAALRKVDPFLVHALIREESRYFPGALSRSNAIGLMQLLVGTAYGIAKHIGLTLNNKDEIFLPDNNIKMGTAYLAHTLERFNGNAMLAVASYNGGPNAVKRWVGQFQSQPLAKGSSGHDWDIFVEDIPYRETRDYVRKVFGSYFVYELLY